MPRAARACRMVWSAVARSIFTSAVRVVLKCSDQNGLALDPVHRWRAQRRAGSANAPRSGPSERSPDARLRGHSFESPWNPWTTIGSVRHASRSAGSLPPDPQLRALNALIDLRPDSFKPGLEPRV